MVHLPFDLSILGNGNSGLLGFAAVAIDLLPFSIVRMILLLAWLLIGLVQAQRIDSSHSVPHAILPLMRFLALLAGPLVWGWLAYLDSKHGGRSSPSWLRWVQRSVDNVWRRFRSQAPAADEGEALRLFATSGQELQQIYGHGEVRGAERQTLDLTMEIIDDAVRKRASDILIDPKDEDQYAVRYRVDGMLRTVRQLPAATCRAVINSIKAVASMDISERRRPQDGAFTARKGESPISFRVASSGVLNGEKLSIRVLHQSSGQLKLTDVGFPERQRKIVLDAIHKPSGMVLVCGPTGSGKTTTFYAMLNHIDRYTHNVITVEDPIEAFLPEVSQIEVNTKAEITFATALRSILRQNPNVICVGEIRDEETAEIAVRAAQTGHVVLATIHCDSNATALVRLLDLGVSPMLLSSALSLLVSQRLVRRLCNCKKPAELDAAAIAQLRKWGIDPARVFQAVGCPTCGNTGYFGRTAIGDLLVIDDELRKSIADDPGIAAHLRADGDKKGRTNLKTEGLRLVAKGMTTLDEVQRVLG